MGTAKLFQRGGPGGPGRPRKSVEGRYLRGIQKLCRQEQWKAICEKAIAQAIEGDFRARDWLSKYLLPDRSQVSSSGEVELRIVHEGADPFGDGQTANAPSTPTQGVA